MKEFLSKIVQGVELLLLALAVFVILFFLILWHRGTFRGDKLHKISAIIKGEDVLVGGEKVSQEDLKKIIAGLKEKEQKLNEESKHREEEIKQKEQDLEMANSVLSVIKKDIDEKAAKVEAERRIYEAKPKPEDEKQKEVTNIAIFNKMDVADIVAVIKDWSVDAIKKYLRQLKPSKAGEVVTALSKDAKFGKAKLDKIMGEGE